MAKPEEKKQDAKQQRSRSNKGKGAKPKRGNSRKPQRTGEGSKPQRQGEEIVDTALDMEKSKSNPYSWYSKNAQFTTDAGNIAAAEPLGMLLKNDNGDVITIPGLMALHFIPTIGYSADLQSPFNRQVIRFRTFLRSIQRASEAYDSADIGMYMMTMDSAYMFWALMRRAYRVALLYTPMNKYYPRQLLAAMGFDPSIADQLADFRMYINKFALSLGAFAMPQDFDINARHMWMCEGLYLDAENTRAQTYLFVPELFWTYNNTVETGSQLEPIWWQQQNTDVVTLHTLDQVKQIGTSIITAFTNDSDTALISGDVYRAYNGRVRQLDEVGDMDQIAPIYDRTVLSQIENATIVGSPVISTMVITQDPSINGGAILFKPSFYCQSSFPASDSVTVYTAGSWAFKNRAVNFHEDSPTPEQAIEATRLTVSTTTPITDNQNVPVTVDIFGADIVVSKLIYRFNPVTYPAFNALIIKANDYYLYYSGSAEDSPRRLIARNSLSAMALETAFDWHPIAGVFESSYTGSAGSLSSDLLYYNGDVDNLTYVSAEKLALMHEAAMWSLFTIPDPDHVAVMG